MGAGNLLSALYFYAREQSVKRLSFEEDNAARTTVKLRGITYICNKHPFQLFYNSLKLVKY